MRWDWDRSSTYNLIRQIGRYVIGVGLLGIAFMGGMAVGLPIGRNQGRDASQELAEAVAKERGWFTSAEVAEREGVSERTITRYASQGLIAGAEKRAGRWRFRHGYKLADKSARSRTSPTNDG